LAAHSSSRAAACSSGVGWVGSNAAVIVVSLIELRVVIRRPELLRCSSGRLPRCGVSFRDYYFSALHNTSLGENHGKKCTSSRILKK
jgi:hypothetical protein